MKEFLLSLFKSDGAVSSKRVIAFIALLLFIVEVICSLCGVVIDQNILYSTIGLICTSLGMTLINTKPPQL